MALRSVSVLVKHSDGSKSSYSVLTRNILHKNLVKVRKSPEQLRADFIAQGHIKPAFQG
jgi:hypothetical protein